MPDQPPPRSRLVPLQEAARELGVNRGTLYIYINKGDLTPYRIPMDRRTFLDRNELRQLRRPRPRKKAD